jgi:hypothetical protein
VRRFLEKLVIPGCTKCGFSGGRDFGKKYLIPGKNQKEPFNPGYPGMHGILFYAVLLANNSKIINNVTKDCYIGLYRKVI